MGPEASPELRLLEEIDWVAQLAEKSYLEHRRPLVGLSIEVVIRGPTREVRSIGERRVGGDMYMSVPFAKVLAIRSSQSLML
jgi:hypothetical protein